MLRLLPTLLLLSLICCLVRPTLAAQPDPRPNIIVILSDDMGYSDLGCYGSEIRTPNLDHLAAEGVRFTQFYNTARCCPTRACLLTGLYPHQAGMGHMVGSKPDVDGYVGDLSRNAVTIAEALRPAGYGTYCVGKWHVTPNKEGDSHNWPRQRGFDRYYGTIAGAANYFNPTALVRENTPITAATDPQYKPQQYYFTDAITDHAIAFVGDHLKQAPGRPFFMYVAYTAAHWPLHAPESDIAKYKGIYDGGYEPIRRARFEREKKLGVISGTWDLSDQSGDWAKVKRKDWEARCMEVYAAQVDRMDQGIGRLVATLRDAGQLDNTLILFLQDNGACAENMNRTPDAKMPGRDDTPIISYGQSWANVSNTPFRMYKHWVHEGGISTPLIVHWPAAVKRNGQLEAQPGHLVDIMATCVDVAKATYPAQVAGKPIPPMEGVSLLPAIQGQPLARPNPLFWEHEGNRAIRIGKWKLVAKSPAGKWELYDMEADRTEMHDLATLMPERLKDMVGQWEAFAKRTHVLPWPWKPPYGQSASPVASKLLFDLKQGDDLEQDQAPQPAGRSITITANIAKTADDGVIVAQGATAEGYSLYIKSGHPMFSVRREGALVTISGKDPLPAAPLVLTATLAKDGATTLSVNNAKVATGQSAGPLTKTPVEGLQVGRDKGKAVADYRSPFKYGGEISGVKIELAE